jgi:hypothetical protein
MAEARNGPYGEFFKRESGTARVTISPDVYLPSASVPNILSN